MGYFLAPPRIAKREPNRRAISFKSYFLELNFSPQNNSWLFLRTGPLYQCSLLVNIITMIVRCQLTLNEITSFVSFLKLFWDLKKDACTVTIPTILE